MPLRAGANLAAIALACRPGLAEARERFVQLASADGEGGMSEAAIKYWLFFTLCGRGVSAVRSVDDQSPRAEKLEEETLVMDWVVWMVTCKPGGRSISWATARKHVSTMQAWHERQVHGGGRVGGGMPMRRLEAMLKGMARDLPGPKSVKRYGVRAQQLAEGMQRVLGGGSKRGS